MSMSAYIRSKNVNTVKGIIVSGFLVCTLALASGGGGGSSGGGGGDGTASNNPTSMYATGKKLFLGSIVCDSCPYASLELNSEESQRRVAQPATRPETGGSDWSGIIVVAT